MKLGPLICRDVYPYQKWFMAYMNHEPVKYIGKMYFILRHQYVVSGIYGWVYARLEMREILDG